jgi:hypothetical protein
MEINIKMKKLLIRIALPLEDYHLDETMRPHGLLFHRWLPDGPSDAIALDTGNENVELKVWFERRGFIRDGWIEFDYDRREVDLDIIGRQAVLDAGPLFGYLQISDLTDSEYEAVVENKIGSQEYINLGKKLAKLIYPPISRLIHVLRINYGQYWINELEPWDSRNMSLGNYFRSQLQLSWSIDDGATWNNFQPTEMVVNLTATVYSDDYYKVYLSEQDYRDLANVLINDYEPTLGAKALAISHRKLDDGDIRYAFIESVIALEIIINEVIHKKSGTSTKTIDNVQSFLNQPLRTQFAILALMIDGISTQDIELATEAINIRNKIVHNGWHPPECIDIRNNLMALLRVCSLFLDGPKLRFPKVNAGNKLDTLI